MKIISVHEGIVPISSSIRNAWIDFSSMDCSIVAIVSDVIVEINETFSAEPADCLPQRGDAHPHLLGQLVLRKPRARR